MVFNLDSSITNEELKKVFGKFGEIKEVRETPNKKHHKFIEFYDVRDAEKAMKMLNKTDLKGKKIKIEPSRPGGARRNGTGINGSNNTTPSTSWNSMDGVVSPTTSSEPSYLMTSPRSHEDAMAMMMMAQQQQQQQQQYHPFGSPSSFSSPPMSNGMFLGSNNSKPPIGSPLKVQQADMQPKMQQPPPQQQSFMLSPAPAVAATNPTLLVANTPPKWNTIVASSPSKTKTTTTTTTTNIATTPAIVEAVLPSNGSTTKDARKKKEQDRKQFQLDLEKVAQGLDKRTTLMIKNIPNKYTQKMLLQTIDLKFKGHYDFFYLPIDFKNKCNVGYAFINFVNPLHSFAAFCEEFNLKKWEKFNSEKVCDIAYARIQGMHCFTQVYFF